MSFYNTEDIFSIFNTIKPKLNDILIKGIESISRENYSEMSELKQQLEDMKLITLNKKLDSFLAKVDQLLLGTITKELKKELAVNTLQIITIIRMFERIMTLEMIKSDLGKEYK